MAERFARGGRLVAFGPLPGRALGCSPRRGRVRAPGDRRQAGAAGARARRRGRRARARSSWWSSRTTSRSRSAARRTAPAALGDRPRARLPDDRVRARAGAEWEFEPPAGDPSSARSWSRRSTTCSGSSCTCSSSTAGCSRAATARRSHDAGASSFLYPFLAEREGDLDAVLDDVRRSVLMKAEEVGELRAQTLQREPRRRWPRRPPACARRSRRGAASCSRSATAARPRTRWTSSRTSGAARPRPGRRGAALDLTEDPAILTAIANDIGAEAIFARQVIAYGAPGDALLALSTSGNSRNVIEALAEARRRGLRTIAMVGYDGGPRGGGAAGGPRRRHALRAHPAHPGGAGERLPPAARARGAVVSRGGAAPAEIVARRAARSSRTGPRGGHGAGRRLPALRLPAWPRELGLERLRAERLPRRADRGGGPTPARSTASSSGSRAEAPPLAAVERVVAGGAADHGRARVRDRRQPTRPASRARRCRRTPRPATTASPSCSTRAIAATATPSSTARTAARASRSSAACPTTGP